MGHLFVLNIFGLKSSARSGGSPVCPLVSWKQFCVSIKPGTAGAPLAALLLSLAISDVARPELWLNLFKM